jgi:hypothetical protein
MRRGSTCVHCANVATLVLLGLSCQPRTFNSNSATKHAAGEIIANSHPSNWYEAELKPFADYIKSQQHVRGNIEPTITSDGPVVARLQKWVDAMHDYAISTPWAKKLAAKIPHPQVVLLNSEGRNASVSAVPVVYDINVESFVPGKPMQNIPPTGPQPGRMNGMLHEYIDRDGVPGMFPGSSNLIADVVAREAEASKQAGYSCTPTLFNGKITFNGCNVSLTASHYAVQQTAQFFVIYNGALRSWTEEQAVGVIAHELGHYYQAHATDDARLSVNHFYLEKDAAKNGHPQPLPANSPLLAKAKETAAAWNNLLPGTIQMIPYDGVLLKILSAPLFEGSVDEFGQLPAEFLDERRDSNIAAAIVYKCQHLHTAAPADCAAFSAAARNKTFIKASSNWYHYNSAEEQAMRATAAALKRIAADIRLDLSANSSNLNVSSPTIPVNLVSPIEDVLMDEVNRVVDNFIAQGNATPTLDAFFIALNARVAAIRAQQAALIDWGKKTGIGWYTAEQVADEIGVELTAAVGLDPLILAEAQAVSLRNDTEKYADKLNGYPYSECMRMRGADDFGFKTGNPRPIPLGDWTDIHHDSCYRLFNIVREYYAHKFAPGKRAVPADSSWASMVQRVPQGYIE